jgi:hypothetical protein
MVTSCLNPHCALSLSVCPLMPMRATSNPPKAMAEASNNAGQHMKYCFVVKKRIFLRSEGGGRAIPTRGDRSRPYLMSVTISCPLSARSSRPSQGPLLLGSPVPRSWLEQVVQQPLPSLKLARMRRFACSLPPFKRLTSRHMVRNLWAYPGDARENTRHRRIASCFNALCNIGLFSKRER